MYILFYSDGTVAAILYSTFLCHHFECGAPTEQAPNQNNNVDLELKPLINQGNNVTTEKRTVVTFPLHQFSPDSR